MGGVCASGEKFAKWISLSYVVKRAANCVCVFGSIIFFDAFGPQMSYMVIGSGLIVYATALFSVYSCMGVLPCSCGVNCIDAKQDNDCLAGNFVPSQPSSRLQRTSECLSLPQLVG